MLQFELLGIVLLAALALLAATGAVVGAEVVRGIRAGQRNLRWWLAVSTFVPFLAMSGLVVAGAVLPDALDRLPRSQRDAIEPAVRASPECGLLAPFARVLEVEVHRGAQGGLVLRYSCGLTHSGVPRFANEASCADGRWTGPGWMDWWVAGSCVEFH